MPIDNLARQYGLAGGYYIPDQSGGVSRSGTARMGDWLNVKDFGATGDGVTDDSLAIRSAMRALKTRADTNTGYQGGMGRLYFPEGVYRILTNNLFSSLAISGVFRSGMYLKGAGSKNSVIWLDPSTGSTDQRFYNNTASTLWGLVCEDLCFAGGTDWWECDPVTGVAPGYTNINAYSKGFKFNGPGYESGFHFNRCEFRWLAQVVEYSGSNNADTHIFTNCQVQNCIDVTYLNNPQSFSITWTDCYLNEIYGDTLKIGSAANGVGNFEMKGGAIITQSFTGKAAMSYVVRMVDGGPGVQTAPYNFQNVRIEVRGNWHGFVNASFGQPVINAKGCSFWNTGTSNKNFITVSGYASVFFDGSSISHGDNGGKLLSVIGGASDGTRGKNAHLAFVNGCIIPEDFVSVSGAVISWTGTGGRLTIDETCTAGALANVSDPWTISYACDTFGPTSLTGEGQAVSTEHRTRRHYEISPFYTQSSMAGAAGLTGVAVQIPPYCRIIGVWVKIEAGVGNGNTVRCRIGNSDKSVVYAETAAAAQNGGTHYVFANVHVPVGSTTNLRRIRFWFDDGAGGNSTANALIHVDGGVVYTGQ